MLDVQAIPIGDIAEALDAYGVSNDWEIAAAIRAASPVVIGLGTSVRLNKPRAAFRNLVVGTIAEGVFESTQLRPLEKYGFKIIDYHEKGENRDFGVNKDNLELPINVKTASTVFRNALKTVGLDPEDCIPVSTYKALGGSKRVPNLIYVDLVDFALREKVDAFVESLVGPPAILWDLFSWYAGKGAKQAQDQYIKQLFSEHRPALEAFVDDASNFRVISAKKVVALMHQMPHRVPGLGIKAAGTGTFNAEVNLHISVSRETQPWADVANLIVEHGIQAALDLINMTETQTVPSPQL